MKKRHLLSGLFAAASLALAAQNPGAVDSAMLQRLSSAYSPTPAERAVRNALNTTSVSVLSENASNPNRLTSEFSHRVPTKGITNQKSSGRCWLFTGLNVLRAQAQRTHNIPELKFSQTYNFFFDQLEKANMFLQLVIDTRSTPMSDRRVDWIFRHPIADGGQFTGVSDNLTKYGVVPASAMSESYISNHTAAYMKLVGQILKEYGLELRSLAEGGASEAQLLDRKEQMLAQVYRMLAQAFGVPPTEFEYAGKTYTPLSFYDEMLGNDLKGNYVMFMNDPSRPYYKMYEIDLDRHAYDGRNWTYLNVPADDIKRMAIESIKDSTAMYFSCDVSKFLNRADGTLDLQNYDYEAILGVKPSMDKAQRILTGASASSHAMTLVGVDLDEQGNPVKWLIENSWGNNANNGHLIATDEWMTEYLFRLVVEKRFVPKKLLKYLDQQPILLPCWDPMY